MHTLHGQLFYCLPLLACTCLLAACMDGHFTACLLRVWGLGFDLPAYLHVCLPACLQVRAISAKKKEPEWMLDFRLRAYRKWLTLEEPKWSDNTYPEFDYNNIR